MIERYRALNAEKRASGHRRTRVYGRFDCPAALRAIAKGGYVRHRVFFSSEAAATQTTPMSRLSSA